MNKSLFVAVVVCFCLPGCSDSGDRASTDAQTHSSGSDNANATHAPHPEHGPHDGDLIELGKEDYHAEVGSW